jgi:hypothetical protein
MLAFESPAKTSRFIRSEISLSVSNLSVARMAVSNTFSCVGVTNRQLLLASQFVTQFPANDRTPASLKKRVWMQALSI